MMGIHVVITVANISLDLLRPASGIEKTPQLSRELEGGDDAIEHTNTLPPLPLPCLSY